MLWKDLFTIGTVLISPQRGFRSLGERRPLLAPWLVAIVLSAVIAAAVSRIALGAAGSLAAAGFSAEAVAPARDSLERMTLIAPLVAPLAWTVEWLATAGLLTCVAVVLGAPSRFRTVLTVTAYAAFPGLLRKLLDLGLYRFAAEAGVGGGAGAGAGPDGLGGLTGLAGILPEGLCGAPVAALLGRLTPFAVWELVLWVVGLSLLCGLPRRRSLAVSLPVWLGALVLGASLDLLGRSAASSAGALAG